MAVSFKDGLKFVGIIIIACCAVLVCNLFLNYDIDLRAIGGMVGEGEARVMYDAQVSTDIVVCALSGGCLALTSVVMLVFYIGLYVNKNAPKFGILKALGYGDFKIALNCAVFGVCVFVGAAAGYGISWAIMPKFYGLQNAGSDLLPNVALKFHPTLLALLVALPTLVFSALSVGVAYLKLKAPALSLIKGEPRVKKYKKIRTKRSDRPFLRELGLNVLNENKALAFFVAFGGFCFSAMFQMGMSMRDYASDMMGALMLSIGLVLATVSLWLSLTTLVNANAKKISMLKVSGYSLKECAVSVLGLYHIPAYIGFAVGSAYQYGLLKIMVDIVFADFEGVKAYAFDWATFAICLAVFVVAYEALNLVYALVIAKTPLKTVMSE